MENLFDSDLEKTDALLRKFEEIHDFIYSHDGLSPQETLEEFIKILFIKIFDELNKLNLFKIKSSEWLKIKENAKDTSELSAIHHLYELTKVEYSTFFEPHDKIKLSEISLAFTVNKLQYVSLTESSHDAKGLAFQKFLSSHAKSDRGQFFTPEIIINFCVNILSPKSTEKVLDPSCGSAGFLISALNYIKHNNKNIDIKKIINENIFGIDINNNIARIANMKLLLESNTTNNIICNNSLEDIDTIRLLLNDKNGFDVILTNPPFGAKMTENNLLRKFELGYKWIKQNDNFVKSNTLQNSQSLETLFIERCIDLLKIGGRIGIVLPNGNFENSSLEYIRHYIMKKTKILCIVNLPQETFIPYGTGVKTSILFLQKKDDNDNDNYSIFFAKIMKLGYQGNKNGTIIYKKDSFGKILHDKNGNQIIDEDITGILKNYDNFLQGKPFQSINTFSVNSEQIKNRFDFDFYSPENRELINNKGKSYKLGEICEIVKVKSQKLKALSGFVDYVELSDINSNSFEIINSTKYNIHELPSRASYEIIEGDILTAIAGNSVGTRKHATALVSSDYSGCVCTNGFRIIRKPKVDPFYLLFFFQTEKYLKQMYMYRTGAAIPSVSDSDLNNILIDIPDEISLNKIINKMKKVIELRKEAKKEFESIIV